MSDKKSSFKSDKGRSVKKDEVVKNDKWMNILKIFLKKIKDGLYDDYSDNDTDNEVNYNILEGKNHLY